MMGAASEAGETMSRTASTRLGVLGSLERVIRVVGGALLAIAAVNLALTSSGVATWAWFGAALLGLDFVVTGLRGYCPLYARVGIGRRSERPERRS